MDRLEAMSILVAAVEGGSLSAAGRALGVPLPTVSRKVSDLEAHIGTRLLVRSTRRLALTDAGAAYVAACRRILDQVGEAERTASGEYSTPRGDLVISAPIVLGRLHVLPTVNAFLAAFPDVRIRLILTDRPLNLMDEHVDVVARVGELPDSTLLAIRVGAVGPVVCASPAFIAGHGTPATPDALRDLPCITFEGLGSVAAWTFAEPGARRTLSAPIRPRLVVNTAEAAIDAAEAGVGVTRVLSYQVAASVAAGRLRIVLSDFEPPSLPVSLLHPAQDLLPLKTRAFLDFAAPRLRERLRLSAQQLAAAREPT